MYLYERMAGIAQSNASIGWSEILFRPAPSERLRSGAASVHTVRGLASINWAVIAPDVTCGMANETRSVPGSDAGTGDGFTLSCSMPGSVISAVDFASFGDPVGSCADPASFRSTHCEMYAAGPGSMGTSIGFQCIGQQRCDVQAATMYWSPTPAAFATCPGPNATWSRRAAAAVECSLPGPAAPNELLLVNVSVPQTATALTRIPRLGRRSLYIWDAHPSNPNRSLLVWPKQGAVPLGVLSVREENDGSVIIKHGPGHFWWVSSTRAQPPPPPPPPPGPPPIAPIGPLPPGDCNVSGIWYGGQAKILIRTKGNQLTIDCPSAWGEATGAMGSNNSFVASGGWCPSQCKGVVTASTLGPCSKMTMQGGVWCLSVPGKPHGVC